MKPANIILALSLIAPAASAQTWTNHPSMTMDIHSYAYEVGTRAGLKRIYSMGGYELVSIALTDTVMSYHASTGWTTDAPMPSPRRYASAATIEVGGEERIYLFGGEMSGGGVSSSTWYYRPDIDTWFTGLSPMPTPRAKCDAVAAQNGMIYVFGGRNGSGSTTYSTVEAYDPVNDIWTTMPSMPTPRSAHEAVGACDGNIYIFGGRNGSSLVTSLHAFEPDTNSWLIENPHTDSAFETAGWTARENFGGTLARNGRIYAMGGNVTSPEPTYLTESYDPYTNTWQPELNMTTNRAFFGAVALGSRVYVMGGYRKDAPHTRKLDSYGALSNLGACSGIVPAGTGWAFGTFCDSLPVAFNANIHDIVLPAGGSDVWATVEVAPATRIDLTITSPNARFDVLPACGANPLGSSFPSANGEQTFEWFNQSATTERIQVRVSTGVQPEVVDFIVASHTPSLGSTYCSPAVPNSTGAPASITASGSVRLTDADLTLTANGLPLNKFGYFLTSQGQAFIQGPGGSAGNLCLGGGFQIGRFVSQVGNSGQTGSISATVDVESMPVNPNIGALVGETWNFQAWYRDAGNTSNFTDAVSVTFE